MRLLWHVPMIPLSDSVGCIYVRCYMASNLRGVTFSRPKLWWIQYYSNWYWLNICMVIDVSGAGFNESVSGTSVHVNGIACTSITVLSNSTIIATVPAISGLNAATAVDVGIRTFLTIFC